MTARDRPAYGWVVLITFTFNYGAIVIVFMALGLLLPNISEELSLSPSQQGWLASSLLFGNLIFEIPISWFLSRFKPWRVASLAFLGATAMVAVQGWSPTFAVLLIARVVMGLFYLSTQPPRTLVILQWLPRKIALANGVMFGFLAILEGAGFMIVPLILVLLGDWRMTLYVWAGVCLTVTIGWMIIGGDKDTSEYETKLEAQEKTPIASIFRYKEPWLMGLGIAGTISGRMAFDTFWPTFTGTQFGTDVTIAGVVIGLISMGGAPIMLITTLIPAFSRHTSAILMIGGVGIAGSYVGTLFTGSTPLLLLLGLVNGFSFGFFPLMIASLYNLPGIKPREIAVAVALVYTIMWGGAALGPLVAGFVQEATDDLRLALFITSLAPLLLTVSAFTLAAGKKRELPSPGPLPATSSH